MRLTKSTRKRPFHSPAIGAGEFRSCGYKWVPGTRGLVERTEAAAEISRPAVFPALDRAAWNRFWRKRAETTVKDWPGGGIEHPLWKHKNTEKRFEDR
jgi:hypothetical protein